MNMNALALSLLTLVSAQDAYQSIGQEVGSIYQRIGAIVSATTYDNDEIRSAHDAAQTAIGSLKYQIGTIDWNLLVGTAAAGEYTSQLGNYIDGLSTVNQYLSDLLTVEGPKPTKQANMVASSIASVTASASNAAHAEAVSMAASTGGSSGSSASSSAASSASKASSSAAKSSSSASSSSSSSASKASASHSSSMSSASRSASKSHSSESSAHSANNAAGMSAGMGAIAAAFAFLL